MSSSFLHCPNCDNFFVSASGFRFHLEGHGLSDDQVNAVILNEEKRKDKLPNNDAGNVKADLKVNNKQGPIEKNFYCCNWGI